MKKLLLIATIGLAALSSALAQDNSTNGLVITTNTVTTVRVSPLKLTGEQLDGVIQLVEGAGIQADAVINAANVQTITVIRTGTNSFTVNVSLRSARGTR